MSTDWDAETRYFHAQVDKLVEDSKTGHQKHRKTSCGNFYVTLNFDDDGNVTSILPTMGKAGNCLNHWIMMWFMSANEHLKHKNGLEIVIRTTQGIPCSNPGNPNLNEVKSCSHGIVGILKEYVKEE